MNLDQFQKDGKFLMLALDHRASFKKLMNPKDPDLVTDEEVIDLKKEIIKALGDDLSALLIDESWGLEAYSDDHLYKPFLLPLEKSGYTDQSGERITEIEYSAGQLVELGAYGAKVLFYFDPHAENSAKKQLETAKKVVDECRRVDLPLFLEIVTYKVNGKDYTQDAQVIFDSVQAFVEYGAVPDVFKLEYPENPQGCERITELLGGTPWIILTNPDTYEVFVKHVEDAISGGSQGFLAGRAIWKEVCQLAGGEKEKFLKETLPGRFREISEIATK